MRTLQGYALAFLLLCVPVVASAQPPAPRGEEEQPLEPRVARQDITIPRIEARDIEIGAFAGVLHLENFGSNPVAGLRLGYHLTEDFFVEGNLGYSEVSDESYRRFGLAVFPEQEETVEYLHLSLGFNALPGEVFAGRRYAFTSALFLTTGVGSIRFAEDDHFTFNVGIGFRVLPTDWLTIRVDAREYIFETDILGESEMTYNLELSAGLAVYF
jgi:outer membrane beta-barrel protein